MRKSIIKLALVLAFLLQLTAHFTIPVKADNEMAILNGLLN
jgi:hypothetical protein